MSLCTLFKLLALAIVALGVAIMLLGGVVIVVWVIGLLIALIATGGPGGAAYAATFGVLIVGAAIVFIGFLIYSFGALLIAISTVVDGGTSSANGFSGLWGGSAGIKLPGLPGLPGLDLGGLFGAGSGLFGWLFMSLEERQKLPPDLLKLVECLRGCLCSGLCQGHSGGDSPNPGQVVVDAGKTLLDDLKAQLEAAKDKLQSAQNPIDVAYWTKKIADLGRQIVALGG